MSTPPGLPLIFAETPAELAPAQLIAKLAYASAKLNHHCDDRCRDDVHCNAQND
jgi:hypothetical protein